MYIPTMFDEALRESREQTEIEKLSKIIARKITGKNKWLCRFGIHKEDYYFQEVFKNKIIETSNVLTYCKRCGKIIDYSGATTIGPIEFNLN